MSLSCSRKIGSETGEEILTYFARFCVATNSDKLSVSQEKLPLYLGFFEFVYNVRKRGKALLGALIELLVS
jgi:hypothetical protein